MHTSAHYYSSQSNKIYSNFLSINNFTYVSQTQHVRIAYKTRLLKMWILRLFLFQLQCACKFVLNSSCVVSIIKTHYQHTERDMTLHAIIVCSHDDVTHLICWCRLDLTHAQQGSHFVLAFPENRVVNTYPVARIHLSTFSVTPVNVTITTPRMRDAADSWWTQSEFSDVDVSVSRGDAYVHEMPYDVHMFGSSIEEKGEWACSGKLGCLWLCFMRLHVHATYINCNL